VTCAMVISRDDHLEGTETRASATNIDLMARQANVGGDSQVSQRYTGYGSDTKVPKIMLLPVVVEWHPYIVTGEDELANPRKILSEPILDPTMLLAIMMCPGKDRPSFR